MSHPVRTHVHLDAAASLMVTLLHPFLMFFGFLKFGLSKPNLEILTNFLANFRKLLTSWSLDFPMIRNWSLAKKFKNHCLRGLCPSIFYPSVILRLLNSSETSRWKKLTLLWGIITQNNFLLFQLRTSLSLVDSFRSFLTPSPLLL